jgi:homocysteine S-methyltransferase
VAALAAPRDVTVLDGGLASELERRGHDLSDPLWSARLLLDAPAEVVAVHRAYFRAGAQVATTASYQASFAGFARRGHDRAAAGELLRRSVRLAQQARDEELASGAARPLLVAASVGPYGAVLADGSEYSGDYGLSDRALRDFHRPRMEVLAEAGPDLLALETVPSQQEAEALLSVLAEMPAGIRAWLSYTCADAERTRRGDPVEQAFAVAAASARVVAVGVNCTAPEHVADLVAAAAATGTPALAYPNSGERWDSRRRGWVEARTGSDEDGGWGAGCWPRWARAWVSAGARLIGGCCRVGPQDIAVIAAALGAPFGSAPSPAGTALAGAPPAGPDQA